ncbi:hypothetical protein BDN72DRAFT_765019 [Pluteus cervinus]|uniref:Uncharacterized protein n=1 Tax=Pluteus cervinus TaxID=181527 RepID=A0ACD3B054_9AGAR|nr:hypothetical protein BDN72DRAFT_765019 [Pluteus cervinus]
MPSIFSRSRTGSTPQKKPADNNNNLSFDGIVTDEFGRVQSKTSTIFDPTSPSRKDKKKAKEQEKRLRTLSNSRDERSETPVPSIPDGSFLPTHLERPRDELGAFRPPKEHDYGYLSYERHVVLDVDQVARLVDVVVEELTTRGGIATPFIFSTTALDISSSAVRRLIRTFLDTCSPGGARGAEQRWREEARFAGPHELAMCLRWGLARTIRVVGGQEVRGLISWEYYAEFRDTEASQGYPPAHFDTFLSPLIPPLKSIVLTILTLLTRLTANSTTSGHTPPSLSPLFGPLFFGLGPTTLAFYHTYAHYLSATNAMEHLILAFIRWQDAPRLIGQNSKENLASGSASALGVPTRLKEWIKGYPAMLPFLNERSRNDRPQPRRGARTVRMVSVRRNVRLYTTDLVKTAASWGNRNKANIGGPDNTLAKSPVWEKIAPASLKLAPRYSEGYKKRMDMLSTFHPDIGPNSNLAPGGMSSAPSASSSLSSAPSLLDVDHFNLAGNREGEDRFRSLTDLKWGEFETLGFSSGEADKKLQFDLTETARTERVAKRSTLSWNDFSSSGFSRTDGPLSTTLQFSTPLAQSVTSWQSHNAEITKKLKKQQKTLPAFGWDTEPVVGGEEVIEETFLDVFCDLIYGSGWMDVERGEMLDRDCNYALIEFKSLPEDRTTVSGGSDPRTSTTLVLFEEYVPLEYRQQLAGHGGKRNRLPSLFSPSNKNKQWKQAATLNGRPYVVGHVPKSPTYRELEFEGLLRGGGDTKIISLTSSKSTARPSNSNDYRAPPTAPALSLDVPQPDPPLPASRSDDLHSDNTMSPSVKKTSRFRLPGGIPVPSPGNNRKSGLIPAEYSTVDFVTREASYSDDEYDSETGKPKRRRPSDDAWVDILVGSQSRRLGGQDAHRQDGDKRRARNRRSDPDLASMEVAQVLASVRDRTPSTPSVPERVDRDYGMDQFTQDQHFHQDDLDVDEIETVPMSREPERSSETYTEDTFSYTSPSTEPRVMESVHLGDDEEEGDPLERVAAARLKAKQQRRMGYFDLHPERRPSSNTLQATEDDQPRGQLGYDRSDDEDDDNDKYGASYRTTPHVPFPTPIPAARARTPEPLAIEEAEVRQLDRTPPPMPELSEQLPPPPAVTSRQHTNGNGQTMGSRVPAGNSKTAALIEMYRERERGGDSTPPQQPAPSRLPVRAPPGPSGLPGLPSSPAQSLKVNTTPIVEPAPVIATAPVAQPPAVEPAELGPPKIIFVDETGRASPARYVHGAPLHNVLEEEEEE